MVKLQEGKNMDKYITIKLTEQEINDLQISVCAYKNKLEDSIDYLKERNKTGINTELIRKKAKLIQRLDAIFDKLYEAEKLMDK